MPEGEENIEKTSYSIEDLGPLSPEDFVKPDNGFSNFSSNTNVVEEVEEVEEVEAIDEVEAVEEVDEVLETEETEEIVEGTEETEEVDEEYSEEEYFNDLSESTGIEINNQEDLQNALTHLSELMSKEEVDPYGNLPSELKLAIETYNKGGDYQLALQQASMDYESMDAKDVLKNHFLNENQELISENKKLAEMRFEKDFNTRYGILNKYNQITDEDEKADFLEENKQEIEFEQAMYEHDVNKARKSMSEFKNNAISQQVPASGFSEEEMEKFIEQHQSSIDNTISNFGGIELNFNDNVADNFVLSLSDDDTDLLKETLDIPQPWLEEAIGIKLAQGSIVDYSKLASAFTLIQNVDKLVSVLGPYYMEKMDKQTIEKITENPPSRKESNQRADTNKSDFEEAMAMFRKQNRSNMK